MSVIQRILDFIDSYIVYCYTHSICQSPVIGGCKICRHPSPCIDPFACIHEMTIMRNRKSGIYSSIIARFRSLYDDKATINGVYAIGYIVVANQREANE